MKIAFTTTGDSVDSPFETRFGRTPRLLIYDLETDAGVAIDNSENAASAHGAGRRTAQTIARSGATGLVTGNCGPKAMEVLTSAGIAVYTTSASTVADALAQFRRGELQQLSGDGPSSHDSRPGA